MCVKLLFGKKNFLIVHFTKPTVHISDRMTRLFEVLANNLLTFAMICLSINDTRITTPLFINKFARNKRKLSFHTVNYITSSHK